ncbi:RAC-alpha serine/threonine-protein kinase [Nowakowskiella sp. JEL0078]|nr:RAC-alpha serine/threonine-protein kinase [Nowakowskiella sp. JEL0078]
MSWAVPNPVIHHSLDDFIPATHAQHPRLETNHTKKGIKTKIPDASAKWTFYQKLVYSWNILVPDEPASQLIVPSGHQLQEVRYGKLHKWRVAMNSWAELPEYLIDHKDNGFYSVFIGHKKSFFPLFDSTSLFLKRWDTLSLILLLYTACVTPFETAFIASGGVDYTSILFEINRIVDQEHPIIFSFLLMGSSDSTTNLSELRLLRFLRLARLLKLLRVLRANKKLSKWQFVFLMLFIIHWLGCGYRLASEKNDKTSDPPGWVERIESSYNTTGIWELYLISIYWSASTIALTGNSVPELAPASEREFGYCFFAHFCALLWVVYFLSSITDVLSISNKTTRTHDLLVDQYLEMFDRLKLDERLKIKVHEYLTDHFALALSTRYTQMLKELPSQLHGFITMEMYVPFLNMIPYIAPFIEREPVM